jgi:hypothetical protein
MKLVYATNTCSTRNPNTGLIVRLVESEPWAADDPFVIARPELFSNEPNKVRRTTPAPAPVEAATKAPGTKKAVKREDW